MCVVAAVSELVSVSGPVLVYMSAAVQERLLNAVLEDLQMAVLHVFLLELGGCVGWVTWCGFPALFLFAEERCVQ